MMARLKHAREGMQVSQGRLGRRWLTRDARALALLLCLVVLAGCDYNDTGGSVPTPFAGCSAATCTVPVGLSQAQVFIKPRDKEKPITQAIATATRSVWVEVYLRPDLAVIHALQDAASRHVDVRVLLEVHPFGGGDVSAQKTLQALRLASVKAQASEPAFTYTHAKTMPVDGATLYVMEYTS